MTMGELKQSVARLSARERRELAAYLVRLRHEDAAWRRMVGRRMKAMDRGKKLSMGQIQRRLARGS